jgi:hypothetical protein
MRSTGSIPTKDARALFRIRRSHQPVRRSAVPAD